VLRASEWCTYQADDEIIREGELDDRFYIIVSGSVSVQSGRRQIGVLGDGDCFGETSYVRGARRTATIKATGALTLVRVSSTLLEQSSSSCQLRFNKVFLRSLIERLQGVATTAT
jgi:eukaryotic-like serine/threonine-protein kinase